MFELVKPPFGGLPTTCRRQVSQARAASAAGLDPCRAGLTVALSQRRAGRRRKGGPQGRQPRPREEPGRPEGGPRRGPKGPAGGGAQGGPARARKGAGEAAEPRRATTGSTEQAKADPNPPRARTRRARPAGRAGDGARGGARNRATGAGGAAVARGHRSDPKGAEGRPGPTEPRRPPPAHRAGAREETAGAGRSPEGANEGPHSGPERPPQGPQGRALREVPPISREAGQPGRGDPEGPTPITGGPTGPGPRTGALRSRYCLRSLYLIQGQHSVTHPPDEHPRQAPDEPCGPPGPLRIRQRRRLPHCQDQTLR